MSPVKHGLVFVAACAVILSDAVGGEVCYIDSNTGHEVTCEPNCCGSNPTYCCDKETFIIQSAVFGSLGAIFIICFVVCCICKKRNRNKKKAAMKEAAAKGKASQASRPTAATGGNGAGGGSSGGGGIVNQGFTAGSVDNLTTTRNHQDGQDLSLRDIAPASTPSPQLDDNTVEAPPTESMYGQDQYPPPATPSLPDITYVTEPSQAEAVDS